MTINLLIVILHQCQKRVHHLVVQPNAVVNEGLRGAIELLQVCILCAQLCVLCLQLCVFHILFKAPSFAILTQLLHLSLLLCGESFCPVTFLSHFPLLHADGFARLLLLLSFALYSPVSLAPASLTGLLCSIFLLPLEYFLRVALFSCGTSALFAHLYQSITQIKSIIKKTKYKLRWLKKKIKATCHS